MTFIQGVSTELYNEAYFLINPNSFNLEIISLFIYTLILYCDLNLYFENAIIPRNTMKITTEAK